MADIVDRFPIEEWDGKGRSEVQVAWNDERGRYDIRIAGYQENGRFAQYPPHLPSDEDTIDRLVEGIREMAQRARQENILEEMGELTELIEEVGPERAKQLLRMAAANEGGPIPNPRSSGIDEG